MSPLLESAGVRSFGLFKATSSAGSFTSIATVTAAGGETSLTFSSIPGTYTDLQIRSNSRSTRAGTFTDGTLIQFNGDSGGNYVFHDVYGNGTTVAADAGSGTSAGYIAIFDDPTAVSSSYFGAGIVDIADYTNTSKYKTTKSISGTEWNTTNTNAKINLGSGLWMSTAAITSIFITTASGNAFAAGTTYALYGIKAAI